jgi:hypothetical protein
MTILLPIFVPDSTEIRPPVSREKLATRRAWDSGFVADPARATETHKYLDWRTRDRGDLIAGAIFGPLSVGAACFAVWTIVYFGIQMSTHNYDAPLLFVPVPAIAAVVVVVSLALVTRALALTREPEGFGDCILPRPILDGYATLGTTWAARWEAAVILRDAARQVVSEAEVPLDELGTFIKLHVDITELATANRAAQRALRTVRIKR